MPWGPVVRVLKAAVLGEDLRIFISFMLMNQNEIYSLNFIVLGGGWQERH